MRIYLIFILLINIVWNLNLFADQEDDATQSSWVIIPGAFYTPETNAGIVLGILNYFHCCGSSIENRPSNIAMNFIYTFEHQYQAAINPTFYIDDGKSISSTQFKLLNYPRKFFGIGNHTPEENESFRDLGLNLQSSYLFQWTGNSYLGPIYHLKYDSITDIIQDGILDHAGVKGKGKTLLSGAGFTIYYDSRDNIFYAKEGQYHQFNTLAYPHFLGSDEEFYSFITDLRFFIPIFNNDSIGFQMYSQFTAGEVPMLSMPTPGGSNLMRGIYQGRYKDKNMALFQIEYRFTLSESFFLTFFGSTGQVASRLKDFQTDELKLVYGAGIRWKVSKKGINLRLDFARGDDKLQVYFTALEAF